MKNQTLIAAALLIATTTACDDKTDADNESARQVILDQRSHALSVQTMETWFYQNGIRLVVKYSMDGQSSAPDYQLDEEHLKNYLATSHLSIPEVRSGLKHYQGELELLRDSSSGYKKGDAGRKLKAAIEIDVRLDVLEKYIDTNLSTVMDQVEWSEQESLRNGTEISLWDTNGLSVEGRQTAQDLIKEIPGDEIASYAQLALRQEVDFQIRSKPKKE
jgi:hypothetical protein